MPDTDTELAELADRLDAEADKWRRRELLAVAYALAEAADVAREWIGNAGQSPDR